MADERRLLDGAGDGSDPAYTGMPRWVKVSLVVVAALVVVFVVLQLVGVGGQHGPAQHMGASDTRAAGGGLTFAGAVGSVDRAVHGVSPSATKAAALS